MEEPLEIQLAHGPAATREWKTIAITMRTPGHDRELAAGFLVGEGLLRSLDQVEAVHSRGPRYGEGGWQHSVRVTLKPGVAIDMARLERNFYTTSSCGVCGKTSMEALELSSFPPLPAADWRIDSEIIRELPTRLRQAQSLFEQTGGVHAAGLFTPSGQPILVREDVGRHNAVDKVVGVGAPASLEVEVAEKFGATLIGFTRAGGFNIYTGQERVRLGANELAALASI